MSPAPKKAELYSDAGWRQRGDEALQRQPGAQWTLSQLCALELEKARSTLSCVYETVAQRVREMIILCSALVKSLPDNCVRFGDPHYREDINKLGQVQHRITKTGPMRRGWGSGFVQPGEGWHCWDLTAATCTYREAIRKMKPGTSQLSMVGGQEARIII